MPWTIIFCDGNLIVYQLWPFSIFLYHWNVVENCEYLFVVLVVAQAYSSDVNKVYVILGNAAIVKCEIPSFVSDFVHVTSWLEDESEQTFYSQQHIGNLFTFKCFITFHFRLKILIIALIFLRIIYFATNITFLIVFCIWGLVD